MNGLLGKRLSNLFEKMRTGTKKFVFNFKPTADSFIAMIFNVLKLFFIIFHTEYGTN